MSELRRRNVLRMAALYVVAAWLIMQVAGVLIDLGALPEWSGPWVLAVLAIGFPIALIFSWFYEITPEGLALEKDLTPADVAAHAGSRRMDFVIIAILAAAVILFAYDKWWPEGPMEQSIAVLAFENLSGDPEQEYFSDGVSEAILDLLGQIKSLRVIARTSSFSFKDKNVDIPTMAAQMNVRHILEGSVRRSGDRLRITAQLIDTTDSTRVWSQSYDRELDDIFAVQDEIAAAISDALNVKLAVAAGEAGLPATIRTADREAYDAYLRGRELIHGRDKDDLREAIRHLQLSISLDTGFAPAHAQLAIATLLYHGYGNEEARRIAERHLGRAQELHPDLAEAHGGWALYASLDDQKAAIFHARRALAVNPNYIDAMHWLSIALGALGRDKEADEVVERLLVTDPLSVVVRRRYANDLMTRGRFEEAHAIADQIIEQSPRAGYSLHAQISYMGEGNVAEILSWALRAPGGVGSGNFYLTDSLASVGEYEEARRIARNTHWIDVAEERWDDAVRNARERLRRNPNSVGANSDTAHVLVLAGHFEEALELYERALELSPDGMPILGYGPFYMTHLAFLRRHAGDEEGAQAAAETARQSVAERTDGATTWIPDVYEAAIAAFDHDPDRAVTALAAAVRHGLRSTYVFEDPLFDDFRHGSRFIAVRQELDEILAEEHDKVLQLICFNNPVPEDWQPMPETCEGVIEKRAH